MGQFRVYQYSSTVEIAYEIELLFVGHLWIPIACRLYQYWLRLIIL